MHLYFVRLDFVGLDVHKQVIAYCVKTAGGDIVMEGKIPATRSALDQWVGTLPGPWHGGLEATMFSRFSGTCGRMLDARTLADLLRANLFPACFVMPAEL